MENSFGPPNSSEGFAVERIVADYSFYYAYHEPEQLLCDPPPLLIATHGYGQSCKNFMRMLAPMQHRGFLILAPQAPNHFYWTRDPDSVGFAWVTEFEPENTLNHILDYVHRLLDELGQKRPYDPDKVFLMGFSQGAATAFRLAAHGVVKPAGFVSFAGKLPEDVVERLGTFDPFSTLIIHGDNDESVPQEHADEAEHHLSKHGFEVQKDIFNGEHLMPADRLDGIAHWIESRSTRT